MDQPKENHSSTSEEIENNQGKISFSDLWNGKPETPMKPKRKYVCSECDEFSTNEKARLDGHYLWAYRIFEIRCKKCDYSHQHPSVLCLVLLCDQNSFGRSKMVLV